jgi:hypothetical protein
MDPFEADPRFVDDDLPPEQPKAKANGKAHGGPDKETKAEDLGFNLGDWPASGIFTGPAPEMRWLIDGTVPLGVPGVLAATGDTGKSFTLLELCMRVAWGFRCAPFDPPILGGQVIEHGSAVFITAEDSRGTVHRRLEAIDPTGEWRRKSGLYIVPLPSVTPPEGKPRLPFTLVAKQGVPTRTPQFDALRLQLRTIPNLKLIVLDPLQSMTTVNLSDPGEGQFVATVLVDLAAETGATVLVAHHLRKADAPPATPEEARQMIRGSTSVVDGVRVAVAMWGLPSREARVVCQKLDQEYKPNCVINCCVVKTNDNGNRAIRTMLRQSSGLLLDVTDALIIRNARPSEMLTAMENAIGRLALGAGLFGSGHEWSVRARFAAARPSARLGR